MTLHNLPFDNVRWGPTGFGRGDKSHLLHVGAVPLTLWTVAEVRGLNLRHKTGQFAGLPLPRQSVVFMPLLARDYDAGCRIVGDFAMPITSKLV